MKAQKERKVREKRRRTKGGRIAFAIAFVVFAAYTLTIIYPLIWTFYNSLKTNLEFFDDLLALPKQWLFSNYSEAFKKISYNNTSFMGMFFNSVWFAGGTALLSVFMHCVTGYIFAKYNFFAKEVAFSFILLTIALPVVGTLPSLYRVVTFMGITDSPLFLVTALGGFGGNFLIMYAYFKSIDWSYAEAAFIDGAGHWYVFTRVMIPLAAGPITALTLLGVIVHWNNYETPILFLDKLPTLSSGLYRFSVDMKYDSGGSPQTVYFAGVLMSVVPIVALVSVFGDRVMENVSMGGIKG